MNSDAAAMPAETGSGEVAPYPGSKLMPRWDVGQLGEAPRWQWRHWYLLLGPGLVMGSSAIGGGEWLTGPLVAAKYGGAMLWLATLSILGQVVYNIEVSRYTLYCGEPIFTGKFRTPPGPMFWLMVYLLLDFGSVLPYLASNAAIPLFAVIKGRLPDVHANGDVVLIKWMGCGIFLTAMLPLVFGGKIYTTLKAIFAFKLVTVMGFLLFLAVFYSTWDTWAEIFGGFFKFGTIPVEATADGVRTANIFTAWFTGSELPVMDFSMIGILAAMAAISGNGGLTNTNVSNYTRDQGWGMGAQVGAIPSIVGGHSIELSHQGKVFPVNEESLPRWKGWLRHIQRDQLAVWMPACFIGLALPSMLSVQFLDPSTAPADDEKWLAAGMTAQGVADAVGGSWGPMFWFLTLFCGFLVLITSMAGTADGVLRRWVDVFWTASPRLREWEPRRIGRFYFGMLCLYAIFGLTMLLMVSGDVLLRSIGMIYNYALGFSCWHTLVVNVMLLPKELRPGWFRRIALATAGLFFVAIGVVSTMHTLGAFTD